MHDMQNLLITNPITDPFNLLKRLISSMNLHPNILISLCHSLLNHRIKSSQESIPANKHMHFNSDRIQHPCDFHSDVSSADNGDF